MIAGFSVLGSFHKLPMGGGCNLISYAAEEGSTSIDKKGILKYKINFKNKTDYFTISTILRNSGVTKSDGTAITAVDVIDKTSQNPLEIAHTAKFFKDKTSNGSNLIKFELIADYINLKEVVPESVKLTLNDTYQIINTDASRSKLYWGTDGSEDENKLIFEVPIELPEQVKVNGTNYNIDQFDVSVVNMNKKYIEEHAEQLDTSYQCKGITYELKDENGQKTAAVTQADNASIKANTIIPEYVKDTNGNTYAVTSIANAAYDSQRDRFTGSFANCSNLKSLVIGKNVKSIGSGAFSYCGLTGELKIPNNVESIVNSAFRSCRGLTSVKIGDGVKTINNYAFVSCSGLTSVKIGNDVESIGNSAFQSCSGLTNITIPDKVIGIGSSAFNGCTNLKSITIKSEDFNQGVGSNAFANLPSTGTIYIPDSKIEDDSYKNLFKNNGLPSAWNFKTLTQKSAE